MLTAVVTTHSSGAVEVTLSGVGLFAAEEEGEAKEGVCLRDGKESTDCPELNPIAPELKEVAWGFGAFVVLALALRLWLYPKVREGMTQRYESIQSDRTSADTLTADARADVAGYEAQLVAARAEAQTRIDAARATLEGERAAKVAEVNARLAERRAAAAAEVEAARAAAMGDVESAVGDVAARAAELATGRRADDATVQRAVRSAMGSVVGS